MRKNLSRLLAGALACISVLGLVGCGGNPYSDLDDGGNKRPEKVLDPSKTQLQVVTFRAGFGDEWLYELEDRFEEAYKDVVYEDGKKGVQVWHEGDTKQYDAQAVISSKYDIFFMEGGDYYALCANGGALEELTDIVTLPNKDDNDKTIFSKMTAQQKSFYGYTAVDGDPKYYAIPHYEGGWGLVYNKELFDRKGYYLASKAGEEPCLISSPEATSEKGTGPDGQTGTEDDGLPRTYEEFFFLCDEIVARDDIPFCWSGKHAEPYLTTMMNTLVADYNGVEQMTLNLDFNGTAQELVVMDGNEVVWENGKIKTETKEITPKNGYDMARQAAKYYAIDFLYKMLTTKDYYNDGAFVSTHDHLMAQTDFLQAGTTFASGKGEMAMLVDGPWWEGEASTTFNTMSAQNDAYSKKNRNFGWMPLPKATEEKVGSGKVYVDSLSAFTVVKAGLGPKKQAALDFVRFSATEASLVEFTQITGALKSYNYTLNEEQSANLSPFTKSLIRYKETATLYVHDSSSAFFQKNRTALQPYRAYGSSDGSGTVSNPVIAFSKKKPISAEEYFENMYKRWKSDNMFQ